MWSKIGLSANGEVTPYPSDEAKARVGLPSLPGCEFLSLDDRKYLKTITALARVLAPNSTSPLARSFGPFLATLPSLASYRAFYPRYRRADMGRTADGVNLADADIASLAQRWNRAMGGPGERTKAGYWKGVSVDDVGAGA